MENLTAQEDAATKAIEKQTKKIPSDVFCLLQSVQWLYHLL